MLLESFEGEARYAMQFCHGLEWAARSKSAASADPVGNLPSLPDQQGKSYRPTRTSDDVDMKAALHRVSKIARGCIFWSMEGESESKKGHMVASSTRYLSPGVSSFFSWIIV